MFFDISPLTQENFFKSLLTAYSFVGTVAASAILGIRITSVRQPSSETTARRLNFPRFASLLFCLHLPTVAIEVV